MKKQIIVCFWFMMIIGFFSQFTFAQGIIVDHTCTDITQIPEQWMDAAKALTLH